MEKSTTLRRERKENRVIPGLDLRRKNGDRTRMGEHEICIAGIPS